MHTRFFGRKPAIAGFFFLLAKLVVRRECKPERFMRRCHASTNPSFKMSHAVQWRFPMVLRAVLLAAVAMQCAVAPAQPAVQLNLPREQLSFGVHRIEVQVASKPEQRQTGLMMRSQMPQQEGMLFVFDEPALQCFWMKNTLLPLTAAFIADDGTVVNLADMQPNTTDSHCSTAPVRYVLEMNQGWFATKRIAPGATVSGKRFEPTAAAHR